MPQLNMTPWFMMMLMTWLFLLSTMTKITNSSPTTTPTVHNLKTTKHSWTWPWP